MFVSGKLGYGLLENEVTLELVLNDWAWIGGLAGLLSMGVVLWLARGIRQFQRATRASEGTLGERLSELKSAQNGDLKLQLFVKSAESAEAGTRALITWSQVLTEHATSVVFDKPGEQGFRQTEQQLGDQRARAEQAGLFLPPELDRPYQRALKAVIGLEIAAQAASHKSERNDRKELCRPAVVKMDQEMLTFLNTVRVWKKRQFFQFTTGEEAAPDSFVDVTNPSFARPEFGSDERDTR